MDGRTTENDPSGTFTGFGADASGVADDDGELGERTRGAATAQITRASAASVTNNVRAKTSDRFPQTGLMNSILIRKRLQRYSSFEGGHRS
jgi:hypothetical protein